MGAVYGGQAPYFYSIDGQSFTTNPIFDRLWAGEYTLSIRDALGQTKNWLIKVKEPANLQVKLVGNNSTLAAGDALELRAIVNLEPDFVQHIQWEPQDYFPQQDLSKQIIHPTQATEFTVTVHDYNGCTVSDRFKVEVEDAKLFFPNVIKPGSDSDAYFTLFSGEGVRRVVSLQVYSRSGALIFERESFPPNAPLDGWDGYWEGKVAQAGVYPYLAVVEFWDGKQLRYEGTVTLIP